MKSICIIKFINFSTRLPPALQDVPLRTKSRFPKLTGLEETGTFVRNRPSQLSASVSPSQCFSLTDKLPSFWKKPIKQIEHNPSPRQCFSFKEHANRDAFARSRPSIIKQIERKSQSKSPPCSKKTHKSRHTSTRNRPSKLRENLNENRDTFEIIRSSKLSTNLSPNHCLFEKSKEK